MTNNINSAFSPLAIWLRSNKRQAFLRETQRAELRDVFVSATCVSEVSPFSA